MASLIDEGNLTLKHDFRTTLQKLRTANRELALRFEKLKKARTSRDPNGIKNAEMEYFQSLQHLYTAVQDAVAERNL